MNYPKQNVNITKNRRSIEHSSNDSTAKSSSISKLEEKGKLENENGQYVLKLYEESNPHGSLNKESAFNNKSSQRNALNPSNNHENHNNDESRRTMLNNFYRSSSKKLYSANLPYPTVKVVEKNKEYARLLLEDYASAHSELTAITSYSFLSIVLKHDYKEITDAYRGISIVEMKHLDILGSFIFELGVLPRYYCNKDNNRIVMWNGSFVSGNIDYNTTLQNSIEEENIAIKQYRKHIGLIDDIYIKKALNRIIIDEEYHIDILNNLYNKYCK